jgi:hypothetical protein
MCADAQRLRGRALMVCINAAIDSRGLLQRRKAVHTRIGR